MHNENIGYAVGYDGKFSRTFDGGLTWTLPVVLGNYWLTDIAFFTDSIGYIVGGSGQAIILKTIDGGNSWFLDSTFPGNWLLSIQAINECVGYATGWDGRILKITNACMTSTEENNSATESINIYPNPTIGKINFTNLDTSQDNLSMEIFDAQGKLVNIINDLDCLDLSESASGIYFYRIKSKLEVIKQGKIILQ